MPLNIVLPVDSPVTPKTALRSRENGAEDADKTRDRTLSWMDTDYVKAEPSVRSAQEGKKGHDKATARYTSKTMRRGTSVISNGTSGSLLGSFAGSSRGGAFWRFDSLQEFLQSLIIMPHSVRYQRWFTFVVFVTLVSGWVQPLDMAFGSRKTLSEAPNDFWAWQEYLVTTVFIADLISKFFIAYYDVEKGLLVTTVPQIARHYITTYKFTFDILSAIPFDWLLVDSVQAAGGSRTLVAGLSLIKMVQLVRFYRVFEFFQQMDYMVALSQGTLLVVRNTTYAFYVTHWSACALYLIATVEGYSPESWVGRNADRFIGRPVYEKYLLSLYFSVSAFTGLGDGALFATAVPEVAFMIVYLLFNLFLGAYILGTVTMLVVKGDERSKAFRDRMHSLAEFSKNNELPHDLREAMQEHLEVTFRTDEASDEQVLGIYPTAIRRKVLRHLYLAPVRNCYLFKGCKARFLDAFLTSAHVELFMPSVHIVTEGDHVSELHVIISGEVSVSQHKLNMKAASNAHLTSSMSLNMSLMDSSMRGGPYEGSMRASSADIFGRTLSGDGQESRFEGATLSEVPFFTDVPAFESAVSTTVVRLLSITKAAWELLVEQFPQQTRQVLNNLQRRQEEDLQSMLQAAAFNSQLTTEQLETALTLLKAEDGLETLDRDLVADTRAALTQAQMDQLMRLDDIRSLVRAHVHKVDQTRTYNFLAYASRGDIELLRTMLNQGTSPNSMDYDGRTGLMLASGAGHTEAIRLLLDHGATLDQVDNMGTSALSEACKAGNDQAIDLLLSYGATLNMDPMAIAGIMCTAVYDGDLVKLRRMLRAGAPPDSCDYDKRSALHIAGAEGNLMAVKLLVEEGGADPNFQDRWGNTALDEARRVGARPVVSYLESLASADSKKDSDAKWRRKLQTDFFEACMHADMDRLNSILADSRPPCPNTAFMIAASEGQLPAVDALCKFTNGLVLERVGRVALVDAADVGHVAVVRALRRLGVQLADPRDPALLVLLETAVMKQDLRVVVSLLEAGVLVTPPGPGELASTTSVGGGGGASAPGLRGQATGAPSTVLHVAAATGNLDLCRLLVELGGASPVALNPEGVTPAVVADRIATVQGGNAAFRVVTDYLRWAAGQGLRVNAGVAAAKHGPLPDVTSANSPLTMEEAESGAGSSTTPSLTATLSVPPLSQTTSTPKTSSVKATDSQSSQSMERSGSVHLGSFHATSFNHHPHGRVHLEAKSHQLSTLRMLAQAPVSAEVPPPTGRSGSQASGSVHSGSRHSINSNPSVPPSNTPRQPVPSPMSATAPRGVIVPSTNPAAAASGAAAAATVAGGPAATTDAPTARVSTVAAAATAATTAGVAPASPHFRVPSPELAAIVTASTDGRSLSPTLGEILATVGVGPSPTPPGGAAGGAYQVPSSAGPAPIPGSYVDALSQAAAVATGAGAAAAAGGPAPDPAAPSPPPDGGVTADGVYSNIHWEDEGARAGGGSGGGGGTAQAPSRTDSFQQLQMELQLSPGHPQPADLPGALSSLNSGQQQPRPSLLAPNVSAASPLPTARLELPRPSSRAGGAAPGSGLVGGPPGSSSSSSSVARPSSGRGRRPNSASRSRLSVGASGMGAGGPMTSPRWRAPHNSVAATGANAAAGTQLGDSAAAAGAVAASPRAAGADAGRGDGGDDGSGRRRSITEEALSELSPPAARAAQKV